MGAARSRSATSVDACELVRARTLFGGRRSRLASSVDACELVRARTLFGGRRLKLDDLNVFETLRFTALSIDPVFLKNDGFLATTGVCGRRSFASVDAFELVRARTLFGGRRSFASVDAFGRRSFASVDAFGRRYSEAVSFDAFGRR